MIKNRYTPPKQGLFGQIFDSIFILILVYASLMIPLLLANSKTEKMATNPVVTTPTWESLNISGIERQQWEKLGYDAATAAPIVNSKFDYTINPLLLLITAAMIIGYFFFVMKVSKKEYHQIIAEKFGYKKNNSK